MAKKELAGSDKFLKWCNLLAVPLLMVSIIPYLPWRYAQITPSFHARFAMHRFVSLMSMSDKMGKMQPFSKWKRNMCATMQIYMQPNIAGELLSFGATLMKKGTGWGPGSTLLGCQQWMPCKEQVTARCMAYTTLFCLGLVCILTLLISAIMSICLTCVLTTELKAKKKKDKEAAAFKIIIISIVGFLLSAGTNVTWQFVSEGEFRAMQVSGYYPVPPAMAGPYIAGLASVFQGLGMLVRLYKQFGPKKSQEEGEEGGEEQYAAYGGDPYAGGGGYPPQGGYPPPGGGYPPPPQQQGMPPALMGAPPPPQMAQPGMGAPPPPPPPQF